MTIPTERLVQVTRWRLGFPVDEAPGQELLWARVARRRDLDERLSKAALDVASCLLLGLRLHAHETPTKPLSSRESEMMADLAQNFWQWATAVEHRQPVSTRLLRALNRSTDPTSLADAFLAAQRIVVSNSLRSEQVWATLSGGQRKACYLALPTAFREALFHRLGLKLLPAEDVPFADALLAWFATWAREPRNSPFIAGRLQASLRSGALAKARPPGPLGRFLKPPAVPVFAVRPPLMPALPPVTAAPPPVGTTPPAPVGTAAPAPVVRAVPAPVVSPAPPPVQPAPEPVAPAEWLDLDVKDRLERHDYAHTASHTTADGLRVLGARVRGKKHRHEGTNCDDWFAFAEVGPWTLVAVSDGAGSKVFSRIGAKAACREAIAHLSGALATLRVTRESWSSDTFARGADGAYTAPELNDLETALHGAMRAGHDAVQQACADRSTRTPYREALGRVIQPEDFSCTLLLAVHTTVRSGPASRSFGMACQVGDGISALVMPDGRLQLLGIPDGGAFSGETEFITTARAVEAAGLRHKTIPFLAPLAALLVMSDGVADDYFPANPELLTLYGDLVANRVVQMAVPPPGASDAALRSAGVAATALAGASVCVDERAIRGPNGLIDVPVRSFARWCEAVGLVAATAVGVPALLAASLDPADPRQALAPEEALRQWLEAYHVRGSFDDRTLVVLHPIAKEAP